MAAKTKKDINDPEFFEDEHLDEIGEPAGIIIPDEEPEDDGVEEGDTDGVVDDEAEGDESADDSDDAPTDEQGEGDSDAVGKPFDPRLTDLESAAVAYNEVRKFASQRDIAARKAEERIAELEASLAEFYGSDAEPEPVAPSYDPNAFAQQAADNPQAAFEYALQSGQHADAQAAIARVTTDASELASLAALARAQNDSDSWHHYNQQAINANALAQEMQGRLGQTIVEERNAPLIEAERRRNLTIAEQALNEQTQGAYGAQRMQVLQVMQRRPHLAAGQTLEEIYEGLRDAYAIAAQTTPQVAAATAQPVVADVDEIARQAVEKHLAETRRAKKQASEAAAGGDTGRSAPGGAGGGEPSEKDSIYQHGRAQSIGARKFMDGDW